jgi:hypothetical protein
MQVLQFRLGLVHRVLTWGVRLNDLIELTSGSISGTSGLNSKLPMKHFLRGVESRSIWLQLDLTLSNRYWRCNCSALAVG